jgi:hypothetical protein
MMEKETYDPGWKDRLFWLDLLIRIADPVLTALAERQLKRRMPVEGKLDDRPMCTHLEAFGRLLCGFAPWLEMGPVEGHEGELRRYYSDLARRSIHAATDPDSPDFMNFTQGLQPLVDSAFMAHALLRAPTELWEKLDSGVKQNVVRALKSTRIHKPRFNNFLLFSAIIETALWRMGEDWDRMRVEYALRQHEQWYVGDGTYGDGQEFAWDYYNSFVIQPMLVDVVEHLGGFEPDWDRMKETIMARARRFSAVQERLISPEGAFPPIGRSLAYRFGAFQLLAQSALRGDLPSGVEPAQVRCALTAVMRRMTSVPGMFDEGSWLRIGFCGHQPDIGETYISTGSLYLCSTVFLPLGLTRDDPFWQGEAPWSAVTIWSGGAAPIDKARYEKH